MDAKEIASQRASAKVQFTGSDGTGVNPLLEESALLPGRKPRPAIPGMTTYQDLMERYKTNIVKTPSGLTFLIQTVNPGDFLAIAGTPLLKYWIEQGVDINDSEARAKAFEEMPDGKKLELGMDEKFKKMVRDVICASVYSLRLVNKRQFECDPAKEELSLDLIEIPDQFVLFSEIMTLSKGEEFSAELELFREASEDGTDEAMADQDSRPGKGLQPAPQPDPVSEDSEP